MENIVTAYCVAKTRNDGKTSYSYQKEDPRRWDIDIWGACFTNDKKEAEHWVKDCEEGDEHILSYCPDIFKSGRPSYKVVTVEIKIID